MPALLVWGLGLGIVCRFPTFSLVVRKVVLEGQSPPSNPSDLGSFAWVNVAEYPPSR